MFGSKEAEAKLAEARKLAAEAEKTFEAARAERSAAEAFMAEARKEMARAKEVTDKAAGVAITVAENERMKEDLRTLEAQLEAKAAAVLEQQGLVNKAVTILLTGDAPEGNFTPEQAAAWLMERIRQLPSDQSPDISLEELTDVAQAVLKATLKLRQRANQLNGINVQIDKTEALIKEAAEKLRTKLVELRDLNNRLKNTNEDIAKIKAEIAARDRTMDTEKAELDQRERQLAAIKRDIAKVSEEITRANLELSRLKTERECREREVSQAAESASREQQDAEKEKAKIIAYTQNELRKIRADVQRWERDREDALDSLIEFENEARQIVSDAMRRAVEAISGLSAQLRGDVESRADLVDSLLSGMQKHPTIARFFGRREEPPVAADTTGTTGTLDGTPEE